jgi:hypothetical protein
MSCLRGQRSDYMQAASLLMRHAAAVSVDAPETTLMVLGFALPRRRASSRRLDFWLCPKSQYMGVLLTVPVSVTELATKSSDGPVGRGDDGVWWCTL